MLQMLAVLAIANAADVKSIDDGPSDSFNQCVLTIREDGKLKRGRFALVPSAEGHRVYEAHAGDQTVRIVNNSGKAFALGKDDLGYVRSLADYPRRKAEGEIEQRKERAAYDRQRAKQKADAEADIQQLIDKGCDPVNHPMVRSVRNRLTGLMSIPFKAQYAHDVPPPDPAGFSGDPSTILVMTAVNSRRPNDVSTTSASAEGVGPLSRAVAAGKIKSEGDLFAEAIGQDGLLFGQSNLETDPYTVQCAPLF